MISRRLKSFFYAVLFTEMILALMHVAPVDSEASLGLGLMGMCVTKLLEEE